MLMGMAVGLAGSPAGVKTFGEEKLVYYREAAAGHSRIAYYVGKVISLFLLLLNFPIIQNNSLLYQAIMLSLII
jgi:ABC-2 type transporter